MKLHKLIILLIAFGLVFSTKVSVFAQDDDDDDDDEEMEEMDEEEWQRQMDDLNAQKTQLQARLDGLNKDIDGLKTDLATKENNGKICEAAIYAAVGHTKDDIADFRKKFDETEKKINSKSGTPADARAMYFDWITNDKARCLPEFADRYASMKSKLLAWEGMKVDTGCYTVVKGDCLWKIAKMKYGNPYLWPAIWDANKDGVANKDQLTNRRHKAVTNPNLIYPGQCLRIPTLTDAQKKEAEMKAHNYRYHRKHRTTTETKTETPKKEEPKKEPPKKETKKDTTKKK